MLMEFYLTHLRELRPLIADYRPESLILRNYFTKGRKKFEPPRGRLERVQQGFGEECELMHGIGGAACWW